MSTPGPIRVLYVGSDESDVAWMRRLSGEMAGAVDVELCASFAEGLERMTAGRHDVHLVAGRVGAGSGLDLLRAYRGSGGDVPVVLIAAAPDRAEDVLAMESGAVSYLERDRLDATLLERAIRYAVHSARRASALRRSRDELEARVAERSDALQTMNAALLAEVGDRRAAERALREADRRKDEFLATLAHELRNPLAPLTSATEILARTGDAPQDAPRRERALRAIERQVAHMVRLIGDLLDVERITHGKLELRRERVPLSAVIESALETAGPLLEGRKQAFELLVPATPVLLHVDPMRIAQVLSNLVSNAAKYTEPGGRIRLEGAVDGPSVVISVADSGIGIPSAQLAHVFTMFGQGQRARDAVHGGLGIGLALAKSIVERHGGELTASSAGEGKGSVFTVRLPCALETPAGLAESGERAERVAPVAPSDEPARQGAPPSPLRILVVDDNVEAALTLSELLSLEGHETHVAHDGPSGVDAARRLLPDVAIFDLGLPGFDGVEAARRLRAEPELSGLRLVAVSGRAQPADRASAREAGFDHHLVKPVELRSLEAVLRRTWGAPGRSA